MHSQSFRSTFLLQREIIELVEEHPGLTKEQIAIELQIEANDPILSQALKRQMLPAVAAGLACYKSAGQNHYTIPGGNPRLYDLARVINSEVRIMILNILKDVPYMETPQLCDELHMSRQALESHLHQLEEEELVLGIRFDGNGSRFKPPTLWMLMPFFRDVIQLKPEIWACYWRIPACVQECEDALKTAKAGGVQPRP